MSIVEFYNQAKQDIIQKGYKQEIDYVEKRYFDDVTPYNFQKEFVYVVCNSGMKNQVAEKIYKNYLENGISAINHPGKKKAIEQAERYYDIWFEILQDLKTDDEKVEYLEVLPFIGEITKYHLARNLGIDCAKPDRHLVRIAEKYGYDDVQKMCQFISDVCGDRIGTVDIVLWRYSNLKV